MLNQTQFDQFLGEQIESFRKQKNLTLDQLINAAGLEMSKATLSAIENGNQRVTAFQLFYISTALNEPIENFFQNVKFSNTSKYISNNDISLIQNL